MGALRLLLPESSRPVYAFAVIDYYQRLRLALPYLRWFCLAASQGFAPHLRCRDNGIPPMCGSLTREYAQSFRIDFAMKARSHAQISEKGVVITLPLVKQKRQLGQNLPAAPPRRDVIMQPFHNACFQSIPASPSRTDHRVGFLFAVSNVGAATRKLEYIPF